MTTQFSSTIRPRFSRIIAPIEDVFYDILKFNPLATTKKVIHTKYGKSAEIGNTLGQECQRILSKYLRINPKTPMVPVLSVEGVEAEVRERAESQLRAFCQDLANSFNHPFVGTITDSGERSCEFTFSEFVAKGGILTRKTDVVKHQHELVGMRIYKNPTSLDMPRKARQIIKSLNLLKPYCRVVAGTLVTKGEVASAQITERTALGKFFDKSTSAAKSVTSSVAAAVASIPVAMSDPAIVIGDKVLFAWE